MSQDSLSKFGTNFQTKSIAVMLSDRSFIDQATDIIDPKHFDSDPHAWIVERILWYFGEYRDVPSLEVFKQEVDKIEKNESLKSGVILSLKDVYKNLQANDITYVKDEFLAFCKNQALKNAILKAADKLQTGDYDSIKSIIDKAMHAGAERNYGHNWKLDIDKRLKEESRKTIPTRWGVLNQLMDGGLGGGELGTILAGSGAGKSWALADIGNFSIANGYKVMHYTLELNQNYLGVRYDTILTRIEPKEVKNHYEEVKAAMDKITGELIIKFYPMRTVTTNALRAHTERLISTGFSPDIILVDYADHLRPTEKGNARYEDLGIIYEDLRGWAGELNVPMWTASQVQRAALQDDIIEADKISESFQKIMLSDFVMSISRKLTDKISNTARVHVIKNRFGPDGLTFPARADFMHGEFQIYDEESAEGIRLKTQMKEGDTVLKDILHQKLIDFRQEKDNEFE